MSSASSRPSIVSDGLKKKIAEQKQIIENLEKRCQERERDLERNSIQLSEAEASRVADAERIASLNQVITELKATITGLKTQISQKDASLQDFYTQLTTVEPMSTVPTHQLPPNCNVVRCVGFKPCGDRCKLTSATEMTGTEPLRQGSMFCTFHIKQAGDYNGPVGPNVLRCEGKKAKTGTRCTVTTATDAGQRLREGKSYCEAHKSQDPSP